MSPPLAAPEINLTRRLRQALAAYWSLSESSPLLDQQTALVHPVRGWEALRGTVPAYRGRPAAFVKVFAEAASFEREQRGLAAGCAVAECVGAPVRVPAVLLAVPNALALVIERVDGVVLSTALRRIYHPSFGRRHTPTFCALGTWLARFHGQECAPVNPTALLAPHIGFIRLNLERVEARLGIARTRRAARLLDLLVGEIEAQQALPAHCHADFQPDNMILSGSSVHVVDFGYARVGYPEQDLVLLRHNLISNSSDLPLAETRLAPLWWSFLAAYGYRAAPPQPRWDLFELRYQSFSARSTPPRDEHSLRRTLMVKFRHLRGVCRFRQWIDRRARVYGV